MKRKHSILLIVLLHFVLLSGCVAVESSDKTPPLAVNGVLDLSEWDFSSEGTVSMDGEWEMYWNRLLMPADFDNGRPAPTGLISVPGFWKDTEVNGTKLTGDGYTTMRLKVITDRPDLLYAIKLKNVFISYKLWVNDQLIASAGTVGRNVSEAVPEFKSQVALIDKTDRTAKDNVITLQISNFAWTTGGMNSIEFGPYKQIQDQREIGLACELFAFGLILIMAIYHLVLFALRTKNKAPLYFGIFCLLLALRVMLVDEVFLLHIFPGINWFGYVRMLYLSFYMGMPALIMLVYSLYEELFSRKMLRFVQSAGIVGSLIVLAAPPKIFDMTLLPYEMMSVIWLIYVLYILIRAVRLKLEGAKMFVAGFLVLFLTAVNDMLASLGYLDKDSLVKFGLLFFIFSQSVILSKKFSRAFQDVEQLSEKLIVFDKVKDEFLANTSHELRTPLNGIIGIAESLIDGVGGKLPQTAIHNLRLIVSSGKRLTSLINDILDFSKLKHKDIQVNLKPVDLHQAVDVALNLIGPLADSKSLQMVNEVQRGIFILADENRLQQIFNNLIGNAVKFTDRGTIRISASRRTENEIEIAVTDTGIGIPADKFAQIFESFEQIDGSASRESGGTGIGLVITRKLLELQDGSIRVDSEPGAGSSFIFTLPAADGEPETEVLLDSTDWPTRLLVQEAAAAADAVLYPDAEQRGDEPSQISTDELNDYVIMIVDDEPINLQVLVNHLSNRKCKVIQALNGLDALHRIEQGDRPDLILLDVMMPRMSGYEVCRKIRERHTASELPIILLTAKSQSSDLIQGFDVGANDYLTKPIAKNELLARIRLHLKLTKWHHILDLTVAERTAEIRTLLDNAGQGFLSVGRDQSIQEEYSTECLRIFGKEISGENVGQLLYPHNAEEHQFVRSVFESYFSETDPAKRALFLSLLPNEVSIRDRSIQILYRTIPQSGIEDFQSVMLVLTDITEKRYLEHQMEKERQQLKMVVNVVTQLDDFNGLMREYEYFYEHEFNGILHPAIADREKLLEILRRMHTFKGNFGQFYMQHSVQKIHEFETRIVELMGTEQEQPDNLSDAVWAEDFRSWLEPDITALQKILGSQFFNRHQMVNIHRDQFESLVQRVMGKFPQEEADYLLSELRKLVQRPFKELLKNYPDFVVNLAEGMGKSIRPFTIEGGNFPVEPEKYQGFVKSLIHVFRNAVDHGIEPEAARLKAGKEKKGTIKCSIEQEDDMIVLTIADDGRGIDFEEIRKKALNNKLCDPEEASRFTKEQWLQLIFHDRLTTKEQSTLISGMGVGLNAVKHEIEKVGGTVIVDSYRDRGTSFLFRIPYDSRPYEERR